MIFQTEEQPRVLDKTEERRRAIYAQQRELQKPGEAERLLEEVRSLYREVGLATKDIFEKIKLRAEEIVDVNVGVVENPDLYKQSELNDEISKLTDEIFKRNYPKTYELARMAVMKGLPKDLDIYNGEEVKKRLILADWDPIISVLKDGDGRRWEIVAGVKPVLSATYEVLRYPQFGNGETLKGYGNLGKLENRLRSFEDNVGNQDGVDILFTDSISSRHDRIRCRVCTNSKFNLNYIMGEAKFWTANWLKSVVNFNPDWNFYMSKWLYKNNGEILVSEPSERNGPRSSFAFFRDVANNLDPEDLVYAAWHTHLKLKYRLGSPLKVEMQVFPREFAAMHNILERVYKQENPDIRVVHPELRRIANLEARGFLESE